MEPDFCVNGHDKNKVGTIKRNGRPSRRCRACRRNNNTNSARKSKGTKQPVRICYNCNRLVVVFSTGAARHYDSNNEVCAGTGRLF